MANMASVAFDRGSAPEDHLALFAWDMLACDEANVATEILAHDREVQSGESVRQKDAYGRLHVATAHISKAAVNVYYGREIPNWQKLGLERDRAYKLLRDPVELERAAETFNNIPLLSRHVAVSASDHKPDLVIGATGSDAKFEFPFLDNSLVVWASKDIEQIEEDLKRELSCSYGYVPDMTPGVFEGQQYDGRMTNITGNHVAVVTAGRAGGDVIIGDSKPEDQSKEQPTMTTAPVLSRKAILVQGATIGYLAGKLAADAKPNLTPVFADITAENYKASKAKIIAGIGEAVKGKIAEAMDISDLPKFLGAFDEVTPAEEEKKAKDDAEETETDEEKAARLKKEDEAKAKDKKAKDAKAAKDKKAKDAEGDEPKEDDDKPITKEAMDEAVQAGAKAAEARILGRMKGAREAEAFVRPWVGSLAVAYDSAEEIERAAAVALKIPDAETVHPSALRSLIKMMPKPGERLSSDRMLASDSAGIRSSGALSDFRTQFPEARAPRRI